MQILHQFSWAMLMLTLLSLSCTSESIDSAEANETIGEQLTSPLSENLAQKNDLPTIEEDPVYRIVDHVPLFGNCDDRDCSDKELIHYLYQNLKYPPEARKNKVEGRIYIKFIVEKDGSFSNARVIRGIGGGCDAAALKTLNNIANLKYGWKPGKHNGEIVRVEMVLPVTFRVES